MKRSLALTLAFTFTSAAAVVAGFAANQLLADNELPAAKLQRDTTPLDRNGPRIVSFADVLDKVTPAVVSVHTSHVAKMSNQERMLRRYYGMQDPRQQEEEIIMRGLGSGFLVTTDGYVLTNNHVISSQRDGDAAEEIIVQLDDGREYDAIVVGTDPQSDVAVLKIEVGNEKMPFLPLGDSGQLRVGDIVFAVGNPLEVGLTVTQGIVSALERTDLGILSSRKSPGMESFIQTDAAINQGNSGGPLVDAQGRVIGINSAIASPNGGSIGIGFAIPINFAASIMDSLVNDGEVRRGFMGVELAPLDRKLAQAFGLNSSRGALINRVNPGLPGDRAGLRHGDVVVGVNGRQVDSVRELIYLISSQAPGEDVTLTVVRERAEQDIDVTLGDRGELLTGMQRPQRELRPAPPQIEPDPLVKGVNVRVVDQTARARHKIPADIDGLLIVEVSDKYAEVLSPGMVILSVNGHDVTSLEAAKNALSPEGVNRLYVYFEEYHRYIPLIVPGRDAG
ncbi:Do family serine endopeptidase [Cerasicoccus arenae]|uniref:Serine endoprotease DegQ n=1 Tax=Cerasicoccus arenae TaxID=424488 RepID=A0A8J3DKS7_9BACT|nr:Do family serine endopeptidase [Cerasicoccus arenae]MBK1857820.1 Do family serine endopeptidase [Cerasicoccus arenae]GHC11686.1 serine endoprotease DegQ [Cerasicoccus arenae]